MRFAAVVLLLLGSVALADEESARYFLQRAMTELDKKRFEKAEKFLDKSLEEQTDYAPAHVGYAQLDRARGRRKSAIAHLEACLAQKDRKDLSPDEKQAMKLAADLMAQLDRARVEFQKMVDAHIKRLMELADKSAAKKPDLATAAYRSVLALDPEHKAAKQGLAEASGEAVPQSRGERLFNGRDLEGWSVRPPDWRVEDGLMKGKISEAAILNWKRRPVAGDFTLHVELRIVEATSDAPMCGIVFGIASTFDHFGLWIMEDGWALDRQKVEGKRKELASKKFQTGTRAFKTDGWHTYRIDRRGKRITCFCDTKKLWTFAGADRPFDGHMGIWLQDQSIEVRHFVLEQK
ncbi:MAG: family 16 glycoside hydrolase [Planctomycetota bacterium]